MSNAESVAACFREGFNCAQAVLSAYGPGFGLGRETALKVAAAFGAGVGRMGETCGAVTGAFMVIGLAHGRTGAGDDEAKEQIYRLAGEFLNRFKSRHGSVRCRELLGCDLGTAEGMNYAKEAKLFETRCPGFIRDAAEILEELLRLKDG